MASVLQGATSAANPEEKPQAALIAKLFFSAMLSVIVMMFSLILYAEDVLPQAQIAADSPPAAHALRGLIRLFCMAAATPVLLILGRPILRDIQLAQSWQEKATESLVLLGAVSAFTLSVLNTFYDGPKVYFETATAVLVIMTIGRALNARSKQQAAKSLSQLSKNLPTTARQLDDKGLESQKDVKLIKPGQRLRVKIGELIPVDGIILQGRSELDESAITGEFESKKVSPPSKVYAGSRNLSGELIIKASAPGGQGTIDQIEKLVKSAWSQPGYKVELAQSCAQKLLPTVLSLALLAGSFWTFTSQDFMTGLQVTLSVLLIACPCALSIATPMALWRGLKECSQLGFFPKTGAILEDLSELKKLYIDKTGTLTEPQLQLNDCSSKDPAFGLSHSDLKNLAYVLASFSDHVLSKALQRNLQGQSKPNAKQTLPFTQSEQSQILEDFEIREIHEVKGRGIQAQSSLGPLKLGSPGFCELSESEQEVGGRDLIFTVNRQQQLSWSLIEALREGASEAISRIKAGGIEVVILSGDKRQRVEAVASKLSVKFHGECLPEEKMRKVSCAAEKAVVAMLGDGLNDAPALASASVGVAFAEGLEVTRDCADAVILGSDLRKFALLLDLAKEVSQRIRWNLTWAFLFNAIGLILAVSNQLNPVWAALAMLLSSLSIVASNLDREEDEPGYEQETKTTEPALQEAASIPALAPVA